ncbi:MAG TPA: IS1595 family transposase [Candidatus Saccharimonadales bacterium]|nr:IS1595 family transposase [Candidatus Saccharimonadales bacterium]
MRYTVNQFKAEYPDDDACLDAVFQNRFGDLEYCPKCGAKTTFYRVKKRQCYACQWCSYQLFPLADTIFRKTTTSLWNWFYAIYLFSVSKNGVSAKELERQLGVTYKTAWRMAKQIRLLMAQEDDKFMGIVEADETYMGGRRKMTQKNDNKTPVVGIVEKRGRVKAKALDRHASDSNVMPYLLDNLEKYTILHTDRSKIYRNATKDGFKHRTVDHGVGTYVHNGVHTNNIEGFWGNMKNSILGTYRSISPKYLQTYVDEFCFRYNHRDGVVYPVLLERVGKRV